MEWEIGELRVKHQLLHLRRDPAGDEEGQSVPGHVRQGRRLKEPGTARTSRAHTLSLACHASIARLVDKTLSNIFVYSLKKAQIAR